MSELRWTLLILGVVFIAALTWWERRRPRQAFAPRLRAASSSHHEPRRAAIPDVAPPGEPWIGESTLSELASGEVALANVRETGDELPTLVISDPDEQLALEAAWNDAPPEPKLIDPESTVDLLEPSVPAPEPEPQPGPLPPPAAEPEIAAAPVSDSPIVEWPPEESRRILALRVVAPPAERFPGRALRLALAAEGFLLGKFSIFHKPDEMNRAVLSAASLSRPGAFDLETMDSQRYGGLTLFVVLPGPKSPAQAFEELLAAARNLNERLAGALQDERGSPLTALRLASLRESLRAEAATVVAASAE
ncbi:MAG TPA: cell division protein ZipA C-terminal FtsZ-binding domain-containing protein [Steroidobacteraceae bacterium]|nr:cell division protein ZipA C-terminal FtsZ-binding domain-containing protein [Steroidobacteraceae bacterium]